MFLFSTTTMIHPPLLHHHCHRRRRPPATFIQPPTTIRAHTDDTSHDKTMLWCHITSHSNQAGSSPCWGDNITWILMLVAHALYILYSSKHDDGWEASKCRQKVSSSPYLPLSPDKTPTSSCRSHHIPTICHVTPLHTPFRRHMLTMPHVNGCAMLSPSTIVR